MSNINTSRRRFLKQGGAMSAAGTVGTSWFLNLAAATDAAADDWSGYKALVCIFLEGGNDACNTVLPAFDDTDSWTRYNTVRGDLKLAKPATNTTGPYAKTDIVATAGTKYHPLHPSLTNISTMLNAPSSKLALVANVGNLLQASDRNTATQPPRLRSHNDQTTVWHHGRSNMAADGWGGRSVAPSTISSGNAQANNFRSVVLGNNNVFGVAPAVGAQSSVRAYGMVQKKGIIPVLPQRDGSGNVFGGLSAQTVTNVMQGNFSTPRVNLIEQDYADVVKRALASTSYMNSMLAQSNVTAIDAIAVPGVSVNNGPVTPHPLALDLQMVAKVITAHRQAGVSGRQVFYVSLGSFDIHTDGKVHAKLLTQLDESLKYFKDALGGDLNNVVAFTASEFGRLLHANGDGCDHGWGGHQIVMGGPVVGGKIYGAVPSYKHVAGSYENLQMTGDGAMVPTISIGAYASTLCKWFGVQGDTNINSVISGAARVGEGSLSGMLV